VAGIHSSIVPSIAAAPRLLGTHESPLPVSV
jgi:hypothetical protein